MYLEIPIRVATATIVEMWHAKKKNFQASTNHSLGKGASDGGLVTQYYRIVLPLSGLSSPSPGAFSVVHSGPLITGRCWKRLIGQPWRGAAVVISWCCSGTYCMVGVHQTLSNTSQSLSLIAVTSLWETPPQLKRHFAEQATVQAASCLRLLHYLTLSLCLSYLAHLVLCSLPNSTNISHMTSLLLALHN